MNDQTIMDRVIRTESKLTRFINDQEQLTVRLNKMLDEWDQFKREWDEEGQLSD